MTIEPRLITGANNHGARGTLLMSFSELTNLETLSPELRDFKGYDRYYNGMVYGMPTYEDQAMQILQAIQTMTKLCIVTMAENGISHHKLFLPSSTHTLLVSAT